jgi:small-conductance mechanosensitive channel
MALELATHAVSVLLVAAVAGFIAAWLMGLILRLSARGRSATYILSLRVSSYRPLKYLLVTSALLIAAPKTGLSGTAFDVVEHVIIIALIGAAAWFTTRILYYLEDTAFRRLPIDVADNRRTRKIRTQIGLLRRLTAVTVAVVALPVALMTIGPLRAFGASLLASAGLLGVVGGLAAQSSLGNVFAGLQLAFSDSLRIDDVIVVEGEWGRVEEIRLTHIVLQLWDYRRLILPCTYFTAKPFQNWTRHESRVLAAIVLNIDYTTPLGPLRTEAQRVIEESPLWDRREWVLQVVDSAPSTMVVRILASAADAPSAWDLRCDIREKLLEFITDNYPESLPHIRATLKDSGAPDSSVPNPFIPDPFAPVSSDRDDAASSHDTRS